MDTDKLISCPHPIFRRIHLPNGAFSTHVTMQNRCVILEYRNAPAPLFAACQNLDISCFYVATLNGFVVRNDTQARHLAKCNWSKLERECGAIRLIFLVYKKLFCVYRERARPFEWKKQCTDCYFVRQIVVWLRLAIVTWQTFCRKPERCQNLICQNISDGMS